MAFLIDVIILMSARCIQLIKAKTRLTGLKVYETFVSAPKEARCWERRGRPRIPREIQKIADAAANNAYGASHVDVAEVVTVVRQAAAISRRTNSKGSVRKDEK
jgi:hypothetical protein